MKNILLWRPYQVGDFILTSAAIRELKKNFPGAYISLVIGKNSYDLAKFCPYVNQVVAFDEKFNFDKNILETISYVAQISKQYFWKNHYDLSLGLGFGGVSHLQSLMMYLSGARERVGYVRTNFDSFLYTKPIYLNEKEIILDYLRDIYILEYLGLRITKTDIEIWYNKNDTFQAKKLLEGFAENRVKIAVGIGANHKERRYPVEKYLVAFKKIVQKGAALVIFGGPSEFDDAKFLEDNLPKGSVKNFVEIGAGWRVDAAAMSLTDMYIGNFTGACDIAAALKKPVIALSRVAQDRKNFFPNDPTELEIYHPLKTPSIILQPKHQLDGCKDKPHYAGCSAGKSHCIAQIEPDEIVDAFEEMIHFKNTISFKE